MRNADPDAVAHCDEIVARPPRQEHSDLGTAGLEPPVVEQLADDESNCIATDLELRFPDTPLGVIDEVDP